MLIYIPPTPFTPPSLGNPEDPAEKVTFYYRMAVGDLPAWSARLDAMAETEMRVSARRSTVEAIKASEEEIAEIELLGEGATMVQRGRLDLRKRGLADLRDALDTYADVENVPTHDLARTASLLSGVIHGWRDKDGMHRWPASEADAQAVLEQLPIQAVSELLRAVHSGAYDRATLGKS